MGRQDYETETLIAHTLRAEGFDASEDGTGRGTPLVPVHAFDTRQSDVVQYGDRAGPLDTDGFSQAVAFAQNSRDEVRLQGGDGDIVGALAAEPGMKQTTYVAFSAKDHGADAGDTAPTLRAMGHAGSHANGGGQVAVATPMAVRRLTPRECERLQGFPDDWTLIPWRGRPADQCPDGPRYKSLGNSMAVPVMQWIGKRIAEAAEHPGEVT
jgi:DNA (cytosine-5)-methyltransferase 1